MRLVKYTPMRDLWDLEERFNRMFKELVPRRLHEEDLMGGWEPASPRRRRSVSSSSAGELMKVLRCIWP